MPEIYHWKANGIEMKTETDNKTMRAIASMVEAAAKSQGWKGEIQFTVCRPKNFERTRAAKLAKSKKEKK